MEFNSKAFFQKYELSEKSNESDLKSYFEKLSSESPVKMIALSKDLIGLRILQTAHSLNALKKSSVNSNDKISDALKPRQVQLVINKFSIDADAYVPNVVMKNGPMLIILVSALSWALVLAFLTIRFFWQHLEILLSTLFSDVVIVAVPLLILIYILPLSLLYIIFPSVFASKEIEGVTTIRDLIYKIYLLNRDLHTTNNYKNAVYDVVKIREKSMDTKRPNTLGEG